MNNNQNITYTSKRGHPITDEEMMDLEVYIKIYWKDNRIKKKEHYNGRFRTFIEYYKDDDEVEADLVAGFALTRLQYHIIQVKNIDAGTIETSTWYDGNVLKGRGRTLINPVGKLICKETLDIKTGLPVPVETEKFFYDNGWDDEFPVLIGAYNADGTLNYLTYKPYSSSGQDEEEYRINDNLNQLAGRLKISPQELDYYLSSQLEHQAGS